ncbi:tyrosine-type recombinase/integrase [Micromonospora sp. NPDC047527]|uniref:tyrosine-type recombinase/integrase n=1 Tax=Micromonospora sp. NPDC047527 TaxID=3155144 RepID=UPI0033E3FCE0
MACRPGRHATRRRVQDTTPSRVSHRAERKVTGDRCRTSTWSSLPASIPIEPRNLNRHFVRLLALAGLRRVCFHDLRHSCATLLYEQGVPIERIQDVLGHSTPAITKPIYVEVTRQAQCSTTDKLVYT